VEIKEKTHPNSIAWLSRAAFAGRSMAANSAAGAEASSFFFFSFISFS
jgi:hypothetical protein